MDQNWWEEQPEKERKILNALLSGPKSTTDLKTIAGHRFSTSICEMRKKGCGITTETNLDCGGAIYALTHLPGDETLVPVSAEWKRLYWSWFKKHGRHGERLEFDGFRCTRCHAKHDLRVHHWRYELFAEQLMDLQTFCDSCHGNIHELAKIAFPKYITQQQFRRLENE